MTREEAIQILQIYKDEIEQRIDEADAPDVKDVYRWQMDGFCMAIEALQAEPNCKRCAIKELWQATEKENFVAVVRCKDCKHYEFADNRAFGMPVKYCDWFGFEDVDDNDFCSRGERKGGDEE